ncbi:MAG: hypothetical protein Q7P63_03085 [Verrucomicrobiota bacterium JB022]|nr:hypothetical protein [Verrucomicrobiota bacterium JB022]
MPQTTESSNRRAQSWPFLRYERFEETLRQAASTWFEARGYTTAPGKGYCLQDLTQWPRNIICPEVTDYIQAHQADCRGKKTFLLHKYLHHGLSSQAMVFNLLGPLILRHDWEPLRSVVAKAGLPWPQGEITAHLEFTDRSVFNEDTRQPTSIDLLLQGNDGGSIFIEAKLAEKSFGGCSQFANGNCAGANPFPGHLDDCYLHYIGRTYWDLLKEQGFGHQPILQGPICAFANYYQFFRELAFARAQGGSFLLLHDQRNPSFLRPSITSGQDQGLWTLLTASLPEKHQSHIGRITIQDLVKAIEESRRHNDWIEVFKAKYALLGAETASA